MKLTPAELSLLAKFPHARVASVDETRDLLTLIERLMCVVVALEEEIGTCAANRGD